MEATLPDWFICNSTPSLRGCQVVAVDQQKCMTTIVVDHRKLRRVRRRMNRPGLYYKGVPLVFESSMRLPFEYG